MFPTAVSDCAAAARVYACAMPESPSSSGRTADIALCLLALGVVLGCVGLGAPPRMESVEGMTPSLATFLEALGPATIVRVAIALALAAVVAGGLIPLWRGVRAAPRIRPLLALAALGLIALIPLPVSLIGIVSPYVGETWEHLSQGGLDLTRTLSVWPAGTRDALWTLAGVIAATAAAFAAVRGAASRRGGLASDTAAERGLGRATLILAFVTTVATLECAYGIATTHFGDDTILGLAKVSGKGRVTGTFVLAPMLGVWAGMGACSAMGLLLVEALRPRGGRSIVLAVSTMALVICVAGGALSLARLMLAALAGGLLVTAWLAGGVLSRSGRARTGYVLRGAALLAPIGGLAAAFLVPALRQRVEYLLPYLQGHSGPVEPRFAGWASTWELFTRVPIFGTGLGSFGRAIHLAQSVDAPDEMWFTHCEPLNLLSDVGVVSFALGLTWLVASVWTGRPALRSSDPRRALLAAAAFGASAVVAVAGLADFQTQFPVVAIPFAALLAIPGALVIPVAPEGATGGTTAVPVPRAALTKKLRWIAGALVALLVIPTVSGYFERRAHVTDGFEPGATSGERHLARARSGMRALSEAADPAAALDLVRADLRAAAREDPLRDAAHVWDALGTLAARSLTFDQEDSDALRDEALAALGRVRWVSRGHADTNLQVGLLYLDLLGTSEAPHGPPGDTAMAALREAGAIRPQAFSRAWREALARELPAAALEKIVPDRGHAQRTWAEYLRRVGRTDEADAILRTLDPEGPDGR